MTRAALLALALVLVQARGAAAEPAASSVDEAAAACAQAVREMRPAGARWRVAVSAVHGEPRSAALAAQLLARLPRAAGVEVARVAPGATFASVLAGGFDAWVSVGAGTLRVQRTNLGWREWLALPMRAWVRSIAVVLPVEPRSFARPRRLDLDLGAPLLALVAADLDGDGRAELIALTTDEVVLLQAKKDTLVARQRVALRGAAPVPRPREPVGTMLAGDLDGDGAVEIFAASSEHTEGLRLVWQAGALVAASSFAGFPVCLRMAETPPQLGTLPLVPGRNGFEGDEVAVACAGGFSGAVRVDGRFTLSTKGGAAPVATVSGVGAAIALADLDGVAPGGVELVASAYRAPGDGDQLTVYTFLAADPERGVPLWKSGALSGGIVAVATGDTDGDGALDIVYAARLIGATRTDVWIVR